MTASITDWTGDIHHGDAMTIADALPESSIHCVVTSPPYWRMRDYGEPDQLGQEPTAEGFLENLVGVFAAVRQALRPDGLVWIVIDDSYVEKSLIGIPSRLSNRLQNNGWRVLNHLSWVKTDGGAPSPVNDRLKSTHETILLITPAEEPDPYLNHAANNWHGNIWRIQTARTTLSHTAVFPKEIPTRAIEISTPTCACPECGTPYNTTYRPDTDLTQTRLQSLLRSEYRNAPAPTVDALRNYQAAIYGDAFRARCRRRVNSTATLTDIKAAYAAAPEFARRLLKIGVEKHETPACACETGEVAQPVVYDPFTGGGTTWVAAKALNRSFVGSELNGKYITEARDRAGAQTPADAAQARSSDQAGLGDFPSTQ